jgi:hypothetical protein
MNQVTEQGKLPIGVMLNGELHSDFELRPATLADTYNAAAAVPVPDALTSNTATRVAYQMAVDDAVVMFQLTRLGTLSPVPPPPTLAAEIDPDDMMILRQAAEDVKKKLRVSRSNLPTIAAPSLSSSAPA